MPRKVRELISDLESAGFYPIRGGKGSHRKFTHMRFPGAVTISGNDGDDAKPYLEKQVTRSRLFMKTTDQYHKWVEWSDEDQTYIGKCPDVITGIHGDDPVLLYAELCDVVDETLVHLVQSGRKLPTPRVRPMQEV